MKRVPIDDDAWYSTLGQVLVGTEVLHRFTERVQEFRRCPLQRLAQQHLGRHLLQSELYESFGREDWQAEQAGWWYLGDEYHGCVDWSVEWVGILDWNQLLLLILNFSLEVKYLPIIAEEMILNV